MSISTINSTPIKPVSFQKSNFESTIDFINEHENFDFSDPKSIQELENFRKNLEINNKNKKYISPLKYLLTVGVLVVSSFFGAKIVGNKLTSILDKRTSAIDFLGKKTKNLLDTTNKKLNLIKIEPNTFKSAITNKLKKILNNIQTKSSEDVSPEMLKKYLKENSKKNAIDFYNKNLVKKSINNLIGIAGASSAAVSSTRDKDENGIADVFERNERKQKAMEQKIIKNLSSLTIETF